MSRKIDRSLPEDSLLWGVALFLAILICSGGYAWWRMQAAIPADKDVVQKVQERAKTVNEPLSITLYYPALGVLATAQASVTRQPDTQSQAREAVAALLTDPRVNQIAVLKDLRLQHFYLDAAGTAYVDLAPVNQLEVRASAGEELSALYAIMNTLSRNFDEVKRVRFLVDGKEAQTLAGHIDLSRKFAKRPDLPVKQ